MIIATDEIWRVVSYQSGTITVQNFGPSGARSPWIGIHYRPGSHVTDEERYALAMTLCRVLNDWSKPSGAVIRTSQIAAKWNGIEFSAIGPMIDKRPPTCWWIEDDSVEANKSRIHLIDSVCGDREGEC